MRKILMVSLLALAPQLAMAADGGPYHVVMTAKVGGVGGFDYINADPAGRKLYIARSGRDNPRITIFDLDTLKPAGEIDGVSAHGVTVDPASHHGFATAKPVPMFDTVSQQLIKSIPVDGSPDGLMLDPFNNRVYILSHTAPEMTAIDAASGNVVGTIALGAAPEHTASDGKGHLYVALESANAVGVVNVKSMTVTARYDLAGKGGTPVGLALDARNHVIFLACREPQVLLVMNADTGAILTSFPIGPQNDGVVFNPATNEAFAAQGDGTLVVIKENSPTSFALEQTLATKDGARTITLDPKTGRVFLMSQDFQPAAAGAAPLTNGRIVRGPAVPDSFTILAVGR
jgi:DNA-binding beta-propeller fold protein YncE